MRLKIKEETLSFQNKLGSLKLYRLMYMSSAIKLFSTNELEALLEISIKNNSEKNITGLLLTKGKTFLQCLEGNKFEVTSLYNKIKSDIRHKDVIVLLEEESKQRLFPNWSMGYENLENYELVKSEKIKKYTIEDIKYLKKSDLYELFEYFVK